MDKKPKRLPNLHDHHEFLLDQREDTDLEREIKALEERRGELERELAMVDVAEEDERKAADLRQKVEELEGELEQRSGTRNATR